MRRFVLGGVICLGVVAQGARAQDGLLDGVGIEADARSGMIAMPSHFLAPQRAVEPLLTSTQGGVLANWRFGPVETMGSVSMAEASAYGIHRTLPLGLLHVGVRRGAFTFMMGFEQRVGLASRSRTVIHPDSTTQKLPSIDTIPAALGSSAGGGATASTFSFQSFAMPGVLIRTANLVGGIGWDRGRAHLSAMTGLQTADFATGSLWVGGTASVDLMDGVGLTLSAQQASPSSVIQTPSFSLGLRVLRWLFNSGGHQGTPAKADQGKSVGRVVRVDVTDSLMHLSVWLPAARRVVVAGDLTDWAPVVMTNTGGWWGVSLVKASGVSRIHLRCDDGAWEPVPGLPTTPDEYGGTMSLLAVPASGATTATITAATR